MLELHANGDSQKQRKDYSKDNSVAEAHLNAIHMMKELHVKKLKNVLGLEKELLLEKYSSKRVYHVKKNGKTKVCCQKVFKCKSKTHCKVVKNSCKEKVEKPKRKFSSCVTFGKSHVKTFKKKVFQNVFKGSFQLVKNRHVSVHTVMKKVNKKHRVVGFAARINGVVVQSITTNNDAVILNKRRVVHLKLGKTRRFKGLKITRFASNKIRLDGGKRGKVVVSTKKLKNSPFSKHKITVRVVKTKKTGGLCVGEHKIKKGRGLFLHTKKHSKKSRKHSKKSRKHTKKSRKNLDKKVEKKKAEEKKVEKKAEEKKAEKKAEEKKEKKAEKKKAEKKKTKKFVKNHKFYTPCPRGSARVAVILCHRKKYTGIQFGHCISRKCHNLSIADFDRARKIRKLNRSHSHVARNICAVTGDPFFINFQGKKFARHVAGDSILYRTNSFATHLRVRRFKNKQYGVTGYAIKVNAERTVVQNAKRNGRYLVSGKVIHLKVGECASKLKNGGSILRETKTSTVITGANGQTVRVTRFKLSKKKESCL